MSLLLKESVRVWYCLLFVYMLTAFTVAECATARFIKAIKTKALQLVLSDWKGSLEWKWSRCQAIVVFLADSNVIQGTTSRCQLSGCQADRHLGALIHLRHRHGTCTSLSSIHLGICCSLMKPKTQKSVSQDGVSAPVHLRRDFSKLSTTKQRQKSGLALFLLNTLSFCSIFIPSAWDMDAWASMALNTAKRLWAGVNWCTACTASPPWHRIGRAQCLSVSHGRYLSAYTLYSNTAGLDWLMLEEREGDSRPYRDPSPEGKLGHCRGWDRNLLLFIVPDKKSPGCEMWVPPKMKQIILKYLQRFPLIYSPKYQIQRPIKNDLCFW